MEQVQKLFSNVYPTYMYDVSYFDQRIEAFIRMKGSLQSCSKYFPSPGNFYFLSGFIWTRVIHGSSEDTRGGNPQGIGRVGSEHCLSFSKEFTLLIGIAFLIAAPLGYYFMKRLAIRFPLSYQYRVGSVCTGDRTLTCHNSMGNRWYKAIRAALVNPVKSLKTEVEK